MKVAVLGDGCLANTTRYCCHYVHTIVDPKDRADVLWVCIDTPVENDVPDVEAVFKQFADVLPTQDTLIVLSSQLPVGSCAELERRYPGHQFVVSPENIRRATPTHDFRNQKRILVGARREDERATRLLKPFCRNLIWMSPESAEMAKHALNGYLAMCISYANELADICETAGANVNEVMRGFLSDERVSPRAPLWPGGPYTGGTLGRDVHVMSTIGGGPLIPAVNESNRRRL